MDCMFKNIFGGLAVTIIGVILLIVIGPEEMTNDLNQVGKYLLMVLVLLCVVNGVMLVLLGLIQRRAAEH